MQQQNGLSPLFANTARPAGGRVRARPSVTCDAAPSNSAPIRQRRPPLPHVPALWDRGRLKACPPRCFLLLDRSISMTIGITPKTPDGNSFPGAVLKAFSVRAQ